MTRIREKLCLLRCHTVCILLKVNCRDVEYMYISQLRYKSVRINVMGKRKRAKQQESR